MTYSNSNAKLVKTTNPKMEMFVGMSGVLMDQYCWVYKGEVNDVLEGSHAFFDALNNYFYTSRIKSIKQDKNVIIITTLNSIYEFEKLKG